MEDTARTINWADQEFAEVRPGIFGATVHTPQLTATLYRYGAGTSWEEHQHSQDQITTVMEGAIDFVVAGEPVHLAAGQLALLPGGTPHSATVPQAAPAISLNVFTHRDAPLPVPDWLGLGGRRALVAGGAGTLGAALVNGFLDAGASVGVADVSESAMADLDERVAIRHRVDLSDAEGARAAVATVRDGLGGLDVFVHCVGINDRRPVEDYAAADWDRIIAVNLTSAFHAATAAAVGMRDQGSGRIIFFSSVAGRSGHRRHAPYAASKGAINQLMRVIAHEYAATGVTANAVAPGYMDTELTRRYLAENPQTRAALVDLIPAGRFGTLSEVVDPVLFLSSPRASFITGQVLYIDGGRTIV